jgi:hypothetical protein
MLIVQAQIEIVLVISKDTAFDDLAVRRIW